jgi:hypothetical protein
MSGLRVLGGCRLQLAFRWEVGIDEIASQMRISHTKNMCKNDLRQMENMSAEFFKKDFWLMEIY